MNTTRKATEIVTSRVKMGDAILAAAFDTDPIPIRAAGVAYGGRAPR